jgi:hypothetical protein
MTQCKEPDSIKVENVDRIETDTKEESGLDRVAALRRASTIAPLESTQSSTGAEVRGLLFFFLCPQLLLRTSAASWRGLWPW